MLVIPTIMSSLHNVFYRNGITSVVMLSEIHRLSFLGESFWPFSPLFEDFNAKIHQMISGGLFHYWLNNGRNPMGLKKKLDDIGPEVLTMDHLEIGFKISLYPLIISITAFLIEISIPLSNLMLHKLVALSVLKAFINVKTKESDC